MTCKNLLLFVCFFYAQLAFGQLDIVGGDVGINNSAPLERLDITDVSSATPSFLVHAKDGSSTTNFIKASAGTDGSAFFYDQSKFFVFVPAANVGQVAASTMGNLLVQGNQAKVGIGVTDFGPLSEQLVVNGNIQATGWNSTSDRRLKKNIQSFTKGLNIILQLNPIKFTYNGKGGTRDGSQHIGLEAQEMAIAAPELVKEFTHISMDKSSITKAENTVLSEETYLSIKSSEIQYLLINAIKEQQAQLDQQQQLIETLQKEIVGLKK